MSLKPLRFPADAPALTDAPDSPARRRFLAAGGAAAFALLTGAASTLSAAPQPAPAFKTRLQRARIIGAPEAQTLRALKAAGFDGVETKAILPEDEARRGRELAEQAGLRIHSVLVGGATREVAEYALRAAHGYGADAILLVPARVSGLPMPPAWDYDIAFDEKTGHLSRVVAGDNAPYTRYIAAHNQATDSARALVGQLVPLAEKLNVTIALENVWNNLWVRPEHFRWLIDACASPRVQAYFDVANNEKYLVPAQEWIRVLGKRLAKIHIKDYQLTPDRHGGKFVHPREGGLHWPAVRQALEEAGYNGFLTLEDDGLELVEYRKRLDEIIAGR